MTYILCVSSTKANSRSQFTPGKWGKIVVPSLPEQHLKLEPRLASLGENAILRFVMFTSGRAPARDDDRKRVLIGRIRNGFIGSWLMFFILQQLYAAGLITFNLRSPVFWIAVTIASAVLVAQIASHFLDHTRTLFDILEKRLMELRSVPITPEDYALAHWGGYLLLDPFWQKFPASALSTACKEMEIRLSGQTGWSYYPSTFGIRFCDELERGGLNVDHASGAALKDQFNLSAEKFSYSKRLDYLTALWREYLEVWWPNQPGEGEARRATLPSRTQKRPLPSQAG